MHHSFNNEIENQHHNEGVSRAIFLQAISWHKQLTFAWTSKLFFFFLYINKFVLLLTFPVNTRDWSIFFEIGRSFSVKPTDKVIIPQKNLATSPIFDFPLKKKKKKKIIQGMQNLLTVCNYRWYGMHCLIIYKNRAIRKLVMEKKEKQSKKIAHG